MIQLQIEQVGNIKKSIEKIDYAIYHDPELIPILFKDTSIKKGLLYSRLRRAVPHKVGIEFEGIGEFIIPYYLDNLEKFQELGISTDQGIADYLGVNSIDCDNRLIDFTSTDLNKYDHIRSRTEEEVRICISDFRQLVGLYRVLELMKTYVRISKGCGIHIHIDLSNYIDGSSTNRKIIRNYLNNHLSEVENIFPKYKGKYNKRIVKDESKGGWINISRLNTLEFRIAPLTHNYHELITWIIKCNKLISKII